MCPNGDETYFSSELIILRVRSAKDNTKQLQSMMYNIHGNVTLTVLSTQLCTTSTLGVYNTVVGRVTLCVVLCLISTSLFTVNRLCNRWRRS